MAKSLLKDMKIKIEEALELARLSGKNVSKVGLAERLFPEAIPNLRNTNLKNMITGRTLRVEPQQCIEICKYCGCSLNFLFGLEEYELTTETTITSVKKYTL